MRSGPATGTILIAALLVSVPRSAGAQAVGNGEPDPYEDTSSPPFAPTLEAPSPWGLGLEGYSGIGTEWTSGPERAHGLVGGLLRARVSYLQLGGTMEITDGGNDPALNELTIEHWRSVGGFAGVWLPYQHWLDLEGAIGVSSRRYVNADQSYGPHGFDRGLPAISLRVGASDRLGEHLFGMRAGAALVTAFDLGREAPVWRHEFVDANGDHQVTTGTTPIGGVSVALVVTLGLEVGGTPGSAAQRE